MYSEHERNVLAEIRAQELAEHPIFSELEIKQFVSYSAGKGRKRRTARAVCLLVRRRGGATAWHKVKHDQLAELLDGNYSYTENEIINALFHGKAVADY